MGNLSVAEVIPQLYISLTTLVFNLLLWIVLEQKGMRHFPSRRPFYFLVVSVFIANIISTAATLFQWGDTGAPGILVSAFQTSVYLTNALVTYSFSVFFIRFISEKRGERGQSPLFNRLLLLLLLLILIAWFAWAAPQMLASGEAIFVDGLLLILVAWVFVVYYMLYCVGYLFVNRRLLMRKERRAIIVGLFLTVGTTIGQGFVGPVLQINFLGGTMGLMILYFYFYGDASPVWSGESDMRYADAPAPLRKETAAKVPESGSRADSGTKERVRRRSIIGVVFAIISALILGSYILLGVLLYRRSEEMFMRELKDNALNNAKTIAAAVDAAAFSRLYIGCQGNEDFNNVLDTLCLFRDNAGLQYVYTTWYDENGIPVMCVDSDPVAPGDMGDDLGYAEATHLALAGTPAVYDTPVTDDWGAHLSAFAPIIYEGTVYGAVGVDLDYTWVSGQLRGIVVLIVIICAVCFAVTLAVLLLLARYLKRKFRLLNSRIDVLSYDAAGVQKIEGLQNGDEFEMIAEHINEVFEKNMAAQHAEAEKLRSAMSEVERKAEEKVARYAAQAESISARADVMMSQAEKMSALATPVPAQAASVQAQTPTDSAAAQAQTDTADLLPEPDGSVTKEEAIRRVKAATPQIMALYRGLMESLQPYFGAQEEAGSAAEDLPEMDAEELQELYEAIAEFAEIYDADGIGKMLQQTEGYAVPEAERERFAKVKAAVASSDWNALKAVLGE